MLRKQLVTFSHTLRSANAGKNALTSLSSKLTSKLPSVAFSTRSSILFAKKSAVDKSESTEGMDPKRAALESALKQIKNTFGDGAIMTLGSNQIATSIEAIPTGSLGLDMALGIGGLPRGRVVEIFGPEMSGKTTLALQMIAEAQKAGGTCVFIDAEHALDPSYAARVGVDVKNLHINQPDSGEQGLEIADHMVRSGAVDMIVIDSVAALVPKAELEGDMGDPHMGLQARLMSQALRKLTASLSRSKGTIIIFINQLRHKISTGIMFGNPETTTGGNALKFYASVRLDVRKFAPLKRGDEIIGNQVRVKIVKNKVAPPFRVVEFDLEFGKGISRSSELLVLGTKCGVVDMAGSWFSYGETKLGQGKDKAKLFLEQNPQIMSEIEAKIRECYKEEGGYFDTFSGKADSDSVPE